MRPNRYIMCGLWLSTVGFVVTVLTQHEPPWLNAVNPELIIALSNGTPAFALSFLFFLWRLPSAIYESFRASGATDRLSAREWKFRAMAVALSIGAAFSYPEYRGVKPHLAENRWDGEVCMQTHPQTCAVASAATLLRTAGIRTTEKEMAELCLTRTGTTTPGLLRGLRAKLRGTDRELRAYTGDLTGLSPSDLPVLLSLWIDSDHPKLASYVARNWYPDVRHCVVVFSQLSPGVFDIGDPKRGRIVMTIEELKVLWHGIGYGLDNSR